MDKQTNLIIQSQEQVMDNILAQFKEHCEYLKDETDDNKIKDAVFGLINALSIKLCWKDGLNDCATFLKEPRREIITVDLNCCDCCEDNVLIFTPYYKYIDETTVKINLYYRDGIRDILVPIGENDFFYSELEDEIRVDLNDKNINICCSPCPTEYKLEVTYEAGVELIPECLMNDLCELLYVFMNKDIGKDCVRKDSPRGLYLTNKKLGEVSYSWSIDKDNVYARWDRLFNLIKFQNISSLSLCQSASEFFSWGYTTK